MKVSKKLLSLIIIIALVLSVGNFENFYNVSAATVTTAYITGTNVNVREGPSLSHNAIDTVSNITATVLGSANEGEYIWYKITYMSDESKQVTGYVRYNSDYIRIVTYDPDAQPSAQINAFPESYRDALMQLSAAYPNWNFIPMPVSISFSDAVEAQNKDMNKQISFSSSPISWRSMGQGSYTWSTGEWTVTNGGWTGASREVIAYYMDPRNFLNASEIFMFLKHNEYSDTVTEEQINKIIANSFMAKGYTTDAEDPYGGSYAKLLIAAGKKAGFNPCVIAAKIIQEQGRNGSSLTSGTYTFTNSKNEKDYTYYGYYNFFNVGASGSTSSDVIKNGLNRAKNEGWNTVYKSIMGGAAFLSNSYIKAGQNTYYFQDFNVVDLANSRRQFAQNVADAYSKGKILSNGYTGDNKTELSFIIPVFTDIPDSVQTKPASNDKLNNYYFSSISVSGLTPSFTMFKYEYDLAVSGDTTVYVKPVNSATYSGGKTFNLKKGENKVELKVKSETGYITTYTIEVDAAKDCILTVDTGNAPVSQVRKGDTNGDGQIKLDDLANIRLHLLGKFAITGDNAVGADTNGDGQIKLDDLANIRLHLLGKFTIS